MKENEHLETSNYLGFSKLLQFHDTRDYVRQILAEQINHTLVIQEGYRNVNDLPDNHSFFWYQNHVNKELGTIPSHVSYY